MNGRGGATWNMKHLSLVPPQTDVALVVRHAERDDIPPGTFGNDVPLTDCGVSEAEKLGAKLSNLRPQMIATSSPVPRCESTARAILRGGDRPDGVALDWRLGDPGPFVVDAAVSGAFFLEIGVLEIVRHQLTRTEPPTGMRTTQEGVDLLLGLTVSNLRSTGRLDVYVTHDGILAVLVAYLFRLPVDEIEWPGYLDGLLMWRRGEHLHFAWRGLEQGSHPFGGSINGLCG